MTKITIEGSEYSDIPDGVYTLEDLEDFYVEVQVQHSPFTDTREMETRVRRLVINGVVSNHNTLVPSVELDHLKEHILTLIQIIEYAEVGPKLCSPWCNGVHTEGGQCEGETNVWLAIEEIREEI